MPFDSSWQADFLDQRLITNFLAPDKPPGPGHHIFLDSLAEAVPGSAATDTQRLFTELGNRINPATGRPFYDLGNNSDNMISLLGSQGGASDKNDLGRAGRDRVADVPEFAAQAVLHLGPGVVRDDAGSAAAVPHLLRDRQAGWRGAEHVRDNYPEIFDWVQRHPDELPREPAMQIGLDRALGEALPDFLGLDQIFRTPHGDDPREPTVRCGNSAFRRTARTASTVLVAT